MYLAGFGLFVAVGIAVFLTLTNAYPTRPQALSAPSLVAILALCPPSLLSAFVIDAETGTSSFYFVWLFIALINAGLYAAVGARIVRYFGRHG